MTPRYQICHNAQLTYFAFQKYYKSLKEEINADYNMQPKVALTVTIKSARFFLPHEEQIDGRCDYYSMEYWTAEL